jgi:hypothetical protein
LAPPAAAAPFFISMEVFMADHHYIRRGGFIHLSREAQAVWRFVADQPFNIYNLGAESVCLRSLLEHPAPKIDMVTLAGVATGVDIARLLVAAIPSESVSDLEFKKLIFEDPEPLTAEAALLPLLGRASIVSDEFRLGIRPGRKEFK